MEKPWILGGCPLKCQGKPNGLGSLGDPQTRHPFYVGG